MGQNMNEDLGPEVEGASGLAAVVTGAGGLVAMLGGLAEDPLQVTLLAIASTLGGIYGTLLTGHAWTSLYSQPEQSSLDNISCPPYSALQPSLEERRAMVRWLAERADSPAADYHAD